MLAYIYLAIFRVGGGMGSRYHNLVPRVSHLTAPWGERGVGGGGKMRDPGNEVAVTTKNTNNTNSLE